MLQGFTHTANEAEYEHTASGLTEVLSFEEITAGMPEIGSICDITSTWSAPDSDDIPGLQDWEPPAFADPLWQPTGTKDLNWMIVNNMQLAAMRDTTDWMLNPD